MNVKELYQGLQRLLDKGEIGNAYSGCGYGFYEPDIDVLTDFYEYILEKYKRRTSLPPWAEAFIQIFHWQYQAAHECAETYYANSYGDSEYAVIKRVEHFLLENGYNEIARHYGEPAVDCPRYQYPKEMEPLLPDDWIEQNDEIIWDFYVDILMKHKVDLIGSCEINIQKH